MIFGTYVGGVEIEPLFLVAALFRVALWLFLLRAVARARPRRAHEDAQAGAGQ
jgi:hypothetical protein